jgi:hypothetical protein
MARFATYGRTIELGDERILRPGKLLWLRSLVWLVGFTFLLALSFGPLGEALKSLIPGDHLPLQFAARTLGAVVALCVYILLVRVVENRRPSELALRPALPELLVGLLLGLAMFGATMAVLLGTGAYVTELNEAGPAWQAAGLAIESGVVEELIIRGVILRLLWRAFGPMIAFVGSAALFGAGHLPNPGSSLFAALCIALEAGIMLGAFYALTGRLWVSIGVHVGWNFTQGYLFGAAVSGGDAGPSLARSAPAAGHPEWLTGGAFGPEASLPALLVCSSVGIATLWAAWRAGRFSRVDGHHVREGSTAPPVP